MKTKQRVGVLRTSQRSVQEMGGIHSAAAAAVFPSFPGDAPHFLTNP